MNYKLITLSLLSIGAPVFAEIITVTDKDFDQKVLSASKPSVVKVSATWCSACTVAKAPFKEISKDESLNDIQFVELDFDNGRAVAKKYNIQGVPTFLYVNNGKVVFQESGSPDANAFKKVMVEKINKHLHANKKKVVAQEQEQRAPEASGPMAAAPAQETPSMWQTFKDKVNAAWDSVRNFFR